MSIIKPNEAIVAGLVQAITPVQTVGTKSTPKQVLAIVTDGRYPETIPVEFFGDKAIDELTAAVRGGLGRGVSVLAGVYLKGREHGGKYYTSLSYRGGSLKFESHATPLAGEPSDADDDLPF